MVSKKGVDYFYDLINLGLSHYNHFSNLSSLTDGQLNSYRELNPYANNLLERLEAILDEVMSSFEKDFLRDIVVYSFKESNDGILMRKADEYGRNFYPFEF